MTCIRKANECRTPLTCKQLERCCDAMTRSEDKRTFGYGGGLGRGTAPTYTHRGHKRKTPAVEAGVKSRVK